MRTTFLFVGMAFALSSITAARIGAQEGCLKDFNRQLVLVKGHGKKLELWLHPKFPRGTARLPSGLVDGSFMRHIQGVTRLPYSNVLVLSGNASGGSYLYAAKLSSQADRGPWTSNVACKGRTCQIPGSDEMISVTPLSSKFKHPGGIQAYGNLVAVGLDVSIDQEGGLSEVRFYDFSDPASPVELRHARLSRGRIRADATAFAKIQQGPHRDRYLVVVHSNSGSRLDFYLSNGYDPYDPSFRFEHYSHWLAKERGVRFADYQSMSIVQQCDGRIFLAGTYKTKPYFGLPWGGKDMLHAYLLELDAFSAEGGKTSPFLMRVSEKHFTLKTSFFSAGGGVFVDPWEENLHVYATDYWPLEARTNDTTLRFEAFD